MSHLFLATVVAKNWMSCPGASKGAGGVVFALSPFLVLAQ